MTTDYSTLDTAALVAAAETLTAEITPGAWSWEKRGNSYVSLEATIGKDDVEDVISNAHRIAVSAADAAFIAAAPALVQALVARLREAVPAYKFNVGDRVRVLPLPQTDGDNAVHVGWPAGLETTITARIPGMSLYMIAAYRMSFREEHLERVENG